MGILACFDAINQILAYVKAPPVHGDHGETAITHLTNCPACQDKVRFLLRALAVGGEDELRCAACLSGLPALVLAQITGEADNSQAPTARHLAICPPCAVTHRELLTLTEPIYASELAEPPYYPAPDLSFLPRQGTNSPAEPASGDENRRGGVTHYRDRRLWRRLL